MNSQTKVPKGAKKLRRCGRANCQAKYSGYRSRVGKPLGRGRSGNKAGKNHARVA